MRKAISICTLLLLLSIPAWVSAQQKDTLIKKLDSLNKKTDSTGANQKQYRAGKL